MKRILFIIAILAVGFYGCGGNGQSGEDENTAVVAAEELTGEVHTDGEHSEEKLAGEVHTGEELVGEEHDESEHEGAITFTLEQQGKIDFAVEACAVGPFQQAIKSVGLVAPAPTGEREVVARANGIAVFAGNSVVEGKRVSAGETLFYVDGGNLTDNNLYLQYVEAENRYTRAKSEYERKLALATDKIVSDTELLSAKTEYLNAEAFFNNIKKNSQGGRQAITAPISGYISHIGIKNGQFVGLGDPLFTVVADNTLYITAEIQQKWASELSGSTTANFRLLNGDTVYSLENLNGKLVAYGRSVSAAHPLLPVTFQVENPGNLVPGSFVETYISTSSQHEAISVPNAAIIEEMGAYFVFEELHEDMFSKVAVTLGKTDGLHTEILSGLTGNERIVTRGAIFVKLAQGTGTLDAHAGHVH